MWLAGGLFLAVAARTSFRNVDRILDQPRPGAMVRIAKLGAADARMLLRYTVAEQNRDDSELWENGQLLLAFLFFFYLLFATREDKFVLGVALLLIVMVAIERFLVTPNVAALGRLLDFVPEAAPSPYRGRFAVLRHTHTGMEMAKWVVQLGLAALLISRSRRSSRNSGRKLNVVDKPDYGHVDR